MKAAELVNLLYDAWGFDISNLHVNMRFLLTEYADDYEIERRNAASIIHIFMRDSLNIPDITNQAEMKAGMQLKDIYDCRVCVQSILQVYTRKIMLPVYQLSENATMFGGRDRFEQDELDDVIIRLQELLTE